MKNLFTLLALLCLMPFYGQKRVARTIEDLIKEKTVFQKFSPLTVSKDAALSTGVKKATYATLNTVDVSAIAATAPEYIELDIPYNDGVLTVLLYKANLFIPGFKVATKGTTDVNINKGTHYRGIIKGDPLSLSSFSFYKNEMSGIISGKGINNLVVGKLKDTGNSTDYIIYSDRQLGTTNPFTCMSKDERKFVRKPKNEGVTTFDADNEKCVTLYFELDYELFVANGYDLQATTNWMTGLFNNIQTLYYNDGINVALHSMYIWSEQDPYFGEDSEDYLIQFLQSAYFEADAGQLIGIDGGLGGLAPLAGLCSEYNMSYVAVLPDYEDVPLFSWNVEAMTHELGHQFGSPHTHSCSWNGDFTQIDACGDYAGYEEGECASWILPENQGTIMSYCHLLEEVGINLANGFGPQPTALMIEYIESSFCIGVGNCTLNVCENTIAGINIVNATPTAVAITWETDSEGPWKVSYSTMTGGFDEWIDTTTPSITIQGLQQNTYYEIGVREMCGEEQSAVAKTLTATGADWCEGQLFTDSGGAEGNYASNQFIVRTFTPVNPEQKVKVVFTEFDLEANFDKLTVIDGDYATGPIIGVYSGDSVPPEIESTAPDGSLTFQFESDGDVNTSGWVANISCDAIVAGQKEFAIAGLAFYPNPSKGIVNISATENIERILICNIAGQQLLTKEVNAAETGIDISSLADGVYFFKAINGNKESNFRIVKQ